MLRLPTLTTLLLVAALALGVAGCGSSSGGGTGTGSASSAGAEAKATVHHKPTVEKVRNAIPQADWSPHLGPVPILVYHDLGVAPASEPWPGLYMTYPVFRSEMAWLHANGYQAVTLDEMMNAWYHGGTLPAKPIVITFDNGYLPQVTFAPHVMAKYGWPGVLNEITVDHLHNSQIWHVLKLGWEVDSHSETHPDLTEVTPEQLHAEVFGSKRFLHKTFHIPVNSFCYPSSEYNAAVIAAVRAAGYTNAVTESDSYATRADPYLLPRFEMTDGLAQLQADLATPH